VSASLPSSNAVRASATAPETARHWERLGFRDDPYYGLHLPVAPIALSLFTGRDGDRTRLREFLAAYPTGMTMVEGPPGVGKTSLVNVVQQELYAAARRFPFFDVVETTEETTRESFLLAVLSGAVSSVRTAFGEDALADDTAYQSARRAVTRTLEYASSMNLTAGVPKLATAGLTRASLTTTPLAPTAQALLDLLRDLVAAVVARGFEGVIVPVNNLDTLDDHAIVAFLNLVRDVCSAVDQVHWVFIGGAYLFELLETRARRVSERFTSNPIALEPLGWPDVQTALERRRHEFALDPQTTLPISWRVSELVHAAGGGELRFTFTRLSRTVLDFAWQYPSERHLPDELAMALLRDWATRHLARKRLTVREQAVADRLLATGRLRQRDFTALGLQTPQRLSQLLKALVEKGYARRVPAEAGGARQEYRPSPAAVLATAPSTFAPPATPPPVPEVGDGPGRP
jgi:hypothetical protein